MTAIILWVIVLALILGLGAGIELGRWLEARKNRRILELVRPSSSRPVSFPEIRAALEDPDVRYAIAKAAAEAGDLFGRGNI